MMEIQNNYINNMSGAFCGIILYVDDTIKYTWPCDACGFITE